MQLIKQVGSVKCQRDYETFFSFIFFFSLVRQWKIVSPCQVFDCSSLYFSKSDSSQAVRSLRSSLTADISEPSES